MKKAREEVRERERGGSERVREMGVKFWRVCWKSRETLFNSHSSLVSDLKVLFNRFFLFKTTPFKILFQNFCENFDKVSNAQLSIGSFQRHQLYPTPTAKASVDSGPNHDGKLMKYYPDKDHFISPPPVPAQGVRIEPLTFGG